MAQQIPPDGPIRELLDLLAPEVRKGLITRMVNLLASAGIRTAGAVPDSDAELFDIDGVGEFSIKLIRKSQAQNGSPRLGEPAGDATGVPVDSPPGPEAEIIGLVNDLQRVLKHEEGRLEATLRELWPAAYAGPADSIVDASREIAEVGSTLWAVRKALTILEQLCMHLLAVRFQSFIESEPPVEPAASAKRLNPLISTPPWYGRRSWLTDDDGPPLDGADALRETTHDLVQSLIGTIHFEEGAHLLRGWSLPLSRSSLNALQHAKAVIAELADPIRRTLL